MTLAYWFVVQCKEGDTEAIILGIVWILMAMRKRATEFLTHGNFVTAGQHLKEIAFRPWEKLNSKRKKVANEKLDHEQHVLPHAACTACTLAQEMEAVAAQLIIEKEKLHEVIN